MNEHTNGTTTTTKATSTKEEASYIDETKSRLKQYIDQRILLFRLQATKKASRIASTLITIVVISLTGLFLLIFGSITLACWLGSITGSLTAGFGLVALLYLIIFLLAVFILKKVLQNFFINKFIHLFHKKD
jgi:hypothetical protein